MRQSRHGSLRWIVAFASVQAACAQGSSDWGDTGTGDVAITVDANDVAVAETGHDAAVDVAHLSDAADARTDASIADVPRVDTVDHDVTTVDVPALPDVIVLPDVPAPPDAVVIDVSPPPDVGMDTGTTCPPPPYDAGAGVIPGQTCATAIPFGACAQAFSGNTCDGATSFSTSCGSGNVVIYELLVPTVEIYEVTVSAGFSLASFPGTPAPFCGGAGECFGGFINAGAAPGSPYFIGVYSTPGACGPFTMTFMPGV